jgi:hypothetical protein
MPDIDVDFCKDRRGEVISYVSGKYGNDHVAQIITFGTLGAKMVVRDVGRVMGMPYGDVDRIAKLIPATINMTLAQALEIEPKLKEEVKRSAEVFRRLPRTAEQKAAFVGRGYDLARRMSWDVVTKDYFLPVMADITVNSRTPVACETNRGYDCRSSCPEALRWSGRRGDCSVFQREGTVGAGRLPAVVAGTMAKGDGGRVPGHRGRRGHAGRSGRASGLLGTGVGLGCGLRGEQSGGASVLERTRANGELARFPRGRRFRHSALHLDRNEYCERSHWLGSPWFPKWKHRATRNL